MLIRFRTVIFDIKIQKPIDFEEYTKFRSYFRKMLKSASGDNFTTAAITAPGRMFTV